MKQRFGKFREIQEIAPVEPSFQQFIQKMWKTRPIINKRSFVRHPICSKLFKFLLDFSCLQELPSSTLHVLNTIAARVRRAANPVRKSVLFSIRFATVTSSNDIFRAAEIVVIQEIHIRDLIGFTK